MHLDVAARWQVRKIGQMIRKEPLRHAVHAQLKPIPARSRSNRIGAGLLLAIRVRRNRGNKLARNEGKTVQVFYNEFEVVALGRFRDAGLLQQTCRKQFTRQGSSLTYTGN